LSPAVKFIEIKSHDYLSFASMNLKVPLKNLIIIVDFFSSRFNTKQITSCLH